MRVLVNGTWVHKDKTEFKRGAKKVSFDGQFNSSINNLPKSRFKLEDGRYILYCNYRCPWSHRVPATRVLKGLQIPQT